MMNTCPICGKRFPVIWPEHWIYKRNGVFYCSEQCLSVMIFRETNKLRQIDKERKRERYIMRRITLEQKKKAVQIAISGGDPREFLKECGSKSPAAMWIQIRQNLKKADPEMYEKLPARIQPKTKAYAKEILEKLKESDNMPEINDDTTEITVSEKDMIEIPEGFPGPVHVLDRPVKVNVMKNKHKITKPVNYGGYDVTAIKSAELGEFYHDTKFNVIDWRSPEGDEISLPPTGWQNLAKKIPEILRILGVDPDE